MVDLQFGERRGNVRSARKINSFGLGDIIPLLSKENGSLVSTLGAYKHQFTLCCSITLGIKPKNRRANRFYTVLNISVLFCSLFFYKNISICCIEFHKTSGKIFFLNTIFPQIQWTPAPERHLVTIHVIHCYSNENKFNRILFLVTLC